MYVLVNKMMCAAIYFTYQTLQLFLFFLKFQICHLKITQEGWTTEFDNISAVPYSYKNDQWITHENIQSVTKKVGMSNAVYHMS